MLLQSGCATRLCSDVKALADSSSGSNSPTRTSWLAGQPQVHRMRSQAIDQLEALQLSGAPRIVNLDLHSASTLRDNVGVYHNFCMNTEGLSVTTSCFGVWKQSKKANSCAKVIPAVRTGSSTTGFAARIFFFDDNVEFDGRAGSSGICNLRDVVTGEFVPFAVGANGFESEAVGRHTVVHHSSQYSNVIVKANILDAMEDPDYFISIVRKYVKPEEKAIVFMDVNSTIMCNDTSGDKDMRATLLSVMFDFIEVRPFAPFDFVHGGSDAVHVERQCTLKQVAKQVAGNAGSSFWREETCLEFLDALSHSAEFHWSSQAGSVTLEGFRQQYARYLTQLSESLVVSGITSSWFKFFAAMEEEQEGHLVVLNSFGVDTRKVVLASVPDETVVTQIAVNYELWGAQDVQKFEAQFNQ